MDNCRDCAERHPHCHSECERYRAFKKDMDAKRAYLQKDYEYDGYRGREDKKIYKCMKYRRKNDQR